eukprot:m.176889 g.176889  ORF g.176889 m.176889 type:complete len:550 (+) comp24467_c0_seq1:938-2587(+)
MLVDDMTDLGEQLVRVGLMEKVGDSYVWIVTDRDEMFNRTNGWSARERFVQSDETGVFIYYDRVAGKFKVVRLATAKGFRPPIKVIENRECFTYVPWATANGTVLFAQVIFAGKGPVAGHIPSNLEGVPLLVQYTENGMQTGATFNEALRQIRPRLKELWPSDPEVFEGTVVTSLDGASPHYDAEAIGKTIEEENISPNIRKAHSSHVTQMWDQIFHYFKADYRRITRSLRVHFEYERVKEAMKAAEAAGLPPQSATVLLAHDSDSFRMDKAFALAIMALMHERDGSASWTTKVRILNAFDKVGITLTGLRPDLLLCNPMITPPPPRDTRFRGPSLPTPPEEEYVAEWTTPPRLPHGSVEYWRLRCLHTEVERDQYMVNPQTLLDAERQLLDQKSGDLATVIPIFRAVVDKGPGRKRPLRNRKPTGDIANSNTGLVEDAKKARVQAKEEEESKRLKNDRLQMLRTAFLRCAAPGATCTCGFDVCVTRQFHYCATCDRDGRKCIQVSLCNKMACEEGSARKLAANTRKRPNRTSVYLTPDSCSKPGIYES